jgi:hypothetical protein
MGDHLWCQKTMSFSPHLNDFIGKWSIDRKISDHHSGMDGRFLGHAVFAATQNGLVYHEEGQLSYGSGPAMAATRDYLWRTETGRIIVDHADGRPFHSFDPTTPEADHWCDPDRYKVRYDFGKWPLWRAEWVVTGPRKDYLMVSVYRRD